MNKTEKGLIARGVDTATAAKLVKDKWTIASLKLENKKSLEKLGLNADCIEALLDEGRPPIPEKTLSKLLFANRFQCCVCRDPAKPIILHHIIEWAKSRSHDADNLVVLCLEHHARAHTTGTLERNLDQKTLREMKASWEQEVQTRDTQSILAASRLVQTSWNYINEQRILEMALALGISLTKTRGYASAFQSGLIDQSGFPLPVSGKKFYLYEGSHILQRYFYMSSILTAVLAQTTIINVSDHLDKGLLVPILAAGDIVFVQGKHVFSPLNSTKKGRGQDCMGQRSANSVTFQFVFDRWEATSSSAKSQWLTGTKSAGTLLQVKDISRSGADIVVAGTALAIASGMDALKQREYESKWLEYEPPLAARWVEDEELDEL